MTWVYCTSSCERVRYLDSIQRKEDRIVVKKNKENHEFTGVVPLRNIYMFDGDYQYIVDVGLDGSYEYEKYSPKFRLNGELLRRFHGKRLSFDDIYLKEYGYLSIPDIKEFSLLYDSDSEDDPLNYPSVIRDENGTFCGQIDFNVRRLTLKIELEAQSPEDDDLFFVINIGRISPKRVYKKIIEDEVQTVIHSTLLVSDYVLYRDRDKEVSADETLNEKAGHIDRHIAYQGAIDKDHVYSQERLYLTEVSRLTDVANSTLSELRSGKKDLDNLSVFSASYLTQFGEIRFLDQWLYETDKQKTISTDDESGDIVYGYELFLLNGQSIIVQSFKEDAILDDINRLKSHLPSILDVQRFGQAYTLEQLSDATKDLPLIFESKSMALSISFLSIVGYSKMDSMSID